MKTRQIFFVNIWKNTFEGSDIWSAEYLKESLSADPVWTVSWASYDSQEERKEGEMDAAGVFDFIRQNGGHTGVLHLSCGLPDTVSE